MGMGGKAGDWAFKAFISALGVTSIYLTANISLNVYSWHNSQSKIDDKEDIAEQSP